MRQNLITVVLVYLAVLVTPLPLLTVSLLGVKKHGSTIVAGLTCLWNIGATNSTIKRRHNKNY